MRGRDQGELSEAPRVQIVRERSLSGASPAPARMERVSLLKCYVLGTLLAHLGPGPTMMATAIQTVPASSQPTTWESLSRYGASA